MKECLAKIEAMRQHHSNTITTENLSATYFSGRVEKKTHKFMVGPNDNNFYYYAYDGQAFYPTNE